MKTKKFFMLLAVVLLSGASAFAQSESETLKGDVNEDGVVDVADINAVIEIMKAGGGVVEPPTYYFSVGTTAPDASNYTTVNNATTTIPTTIEFTSSARVRHYFLIPNNKTLIVLDKTLQVAVPITENTSISIPNHKVYQTNGAIAATATVIITLSDVQPTYYWYIGKDEALLGKSGTSYDLDLTKLPTVSSINDIYSDSQPVGDIENNIYVVCPTEWVGQFKLTDLDNFEIPQTDKTSQITSGVTGYSILRSNGKGMDSIIKVVKI